MASYNISDNLSDDQILILLQQLFTNMNNLDRLYYDMFINRTPLTLTLERYNDSGVLETFELPNRAMDRLVQNKLSGKGSPERVQQADAGTYYIDILTSNIWFKTTDDSTTGWVMLYTPANFVEGEQFLAPDGDASHLTGLSATNLTGGTLGVRVGGTGTSYPLNGILRGNGEEPFSVATAGIDYLAPQMFIGSLGLFMRNADATDDTPSLLSFGWLPCNGAHYNQVNYPTLYKALKSIYPNREIDRHTDTITGQMFYYDHYGNRIDIEPDEFAVPNLQDMYLRGWNADRLLNTYQGSAVPNIYGEFFNSQERESSLPYQDPNDTPTGCFSRKTVTGNGVGGNDGWFEILAFDAKDYKPIINGVEQESVYTDEFNEVRTNNISTLICIYAGNKGVTYSYDNTETE